MNSTHTAFGWRRVTALALLATLVGCAPRPTLTPGLGASGGRVSNLPETPSENLARLQQLSAERRAKESPTDYILGEGDLLSVRAVGLDDLTQRARVEGDGTITLPLVNAVPVAGKTVTEAQRELTRRVAEFMYNPNVTLFVEEFRSRQVGVVGAVQHPGLVSLTVQHSTVLDALSAAGGMMPDATGRVYLIPAESRPRATPEPVQLAMREDTGVGAAPSAGGHAPIMLDMKELGQAAESTFFSLPVRPGDVVMVPGAGEFIVGGWVEKPGNYPLKTTLTLRGAIATSGGLSFPADKSQIHIHRLTANGDTESHDVDFAAIDAQRVSDVFIHDGDVIDVGASKVKLVPYAVYKVFTDLIRFGAGVRVAP
jgi:protein involved in polysaccharide export with SLBB domain